MAVVNTAMKVEVSSSYTRLLVWVACLIKNKSNYVFRDPYADRRMHYKARPGRPIIFIGPNGTGKSRLGIHIDSLEDAGPSYRIGAQRSLELPDEDFSDKYERAIGLFRRDRRRGQPSAGSMEQNYDEVLVALFAERLQALELAHEKSTGRKNSIRPVTMIDRLQVLWHELIPTQRLLFSEATVRAFRID